MKRIITLIRLLLAYFKMVFKKKQLQTHRGGGNAVKTPKIGKRINFLKYSGFKAYQKVPSIDLSYRFKRKTKCQRKLQKMQ